MRWTGCPRRVAGVAGYEPMSDDAEQRSKSNIRLAIILGLVAFGFFLMGIYLAMDKGV